MPMQTKDHEPSAHFDAYGWLRGAEMLLKKSYSIN